MEVLVFGGTSEGRCITEWLAGRGVQVTACSATAYGGDVLAESECITALTQPLGHDGMRALMGEHSYACVVDATHPYATRITEHVAQAAQEKGVPYLRLIREGEPEGDWTGAVDVASAAALANEVQGNILLTTGSKDLATFTAAVEGFQTRLYARVLPVVASVEHANELGIPTSHIIAMQGPFSTEMNCALIHEFDIACLVTKASGKAGGFWEKVEAAKTCGVELIVVNRPTVEEGLNYEQVQQVLVDQYGV